MNRLVLLMYHSLYANERELANIDVNDRPYAVSQRAFAVQLDALHAAGLPVLDPATLRGGAAQGGVVITFDDGHASNRHLALPALQVRGIRAAFFVTSDFVGQRSGFCSRDDLRALADAGMTIGSHGRTHRFLADLSNDEAAAELRDSKAMLEDCIARPVDQVSFPGGRFRPSQIESFLELGYALFHSSRIGSRRASVLPAGTILPRLPIRRTTSVDECILMGRASPTWMWRAQSIGAVKNLLRSAVGNSAYHALYSRLYGRSDS